MELIEIKLPNEPIEEKLQNEPVEVESDKRNKHRKVFIFFAFIAVMILICVLSMKFFKVSETPIINNSIDPNTSGLQLNETKQVEPSETTSIHDENLSENPLKNLNDNLEAEFSSVNFESEINFDSYNKLPSDFKPDFYKGIPVVHRAFIWGQVMLKVCGDKSDFEEVKNNDVDNLESLDCMNNITLDSNRTLTAHPKFSKNESDESLNEMQKKLAIVLIKYGKFDKEIGYIQGINYVAGFLCIYFQPKEALFFLKFLMKSKELRNLYVESDDKKEELWKSIFEIIQKHEIKLLETIIKCDQGIDTLKIHSSSLLKVMFVKGDNFELIARIWDLFAKYNFDLYKVFPLLILTLLKINITQILAANDIGDLVNVFKNWMSVDPNEFIEAFKKVEAQMNPEKSTGPITKIKDKILNYFKK